MRTTLTVDDDVAPLLDLHMHQTGASLRTAVNDLLRLGLMAASQESNKPFHVEPRPLELPAGLNYDNIQELLERLEGDRER